MAEYWGFWGGVFIALTFVFAAIEVAILERKNRKK